MAMVLYEPSSLDHDARCDLNYLMGTTLAEVRHVELHDDFVGELRVLRVPTLSFVLD
jgi:hypothetical protein